MNAKQFKILLVAMVIVLGSCDDAQKEQKNIRQYNAIATEIQNNYRNNKNQFLEFNRYFKLDHIKTLEFSDTQIAWLQFRMGNSSDNNALQDIKNMPLSSTEVLSVLALDSLAPKDVMELKSLMIRNHVTRFRIVDYFDTHTGKAPKGIDLRYDKGFDGLTFYYRISQLPIDSMPKGSHDLLLNNDSTGKIIDENVLWYYK